MSSIVIFVMPGLVPGIHVFCICVTIEDVDGRDKPSHDVEMLFRRLPIRHITPAVTPHAHVGLLGMRDEAFQHAQP